MTIQMLSKIMHHIESHYMIPEDITDDWCDLSINGDSVVFDYGDEGVTKFTLEKGIVHEYMETDDGDLFEVIGEKLCKV